MKECCGEVLYGEVLRTGVVEKCCEGVVKWCRDVVVGKCCIEKCCGEALQGRVVKKCCGEVLGRSVVERCCEEML